MNPAQGQSPRILANRYEVADLLGRGGMASVHLGRDTRLGRKVAIKLLRADMARDPSFHARFRREAQSAAALNHPSIVAVYDTGEDVVPGPGGEPEQLPYIVMEYVEGRTLRDILHDQEHPDEHVPAGVDEQTRLTLPPTGSPRDAATTTSLRGMDVRQAVTMTAGVLSALEYSHRAGIVHRDIKPANVMVTPRGEIKVMDFGIARALADSSATMTQTQAVIGTAQYLSPEQARGETVDARSDLYSAGCLLYELLTGRPPFVGDSPVSVAYQHVREIAQPPSTHNPDVPEALDRVVMHALEKDRDDRYPDAHSFRVDLLAAVAGRPVSAPAVGAAAAAAAVGASAGDVTVALPAADVVDTGGFAARTASPGQTVTIGRADDGTAEPRRGRAAGYAALALAVLAVFALAVFLATQFLGGPGGDDAKVAVPTVVGMDKVAAKAALTNAGLDYAEGTPQNSDAPPNQVIDQNPPAQTPVATGSTVTVVLSLGPGEVTIPKLAGQKEAAARAAIESAGLKVGEVTPQNDPDTPAGVVISSSPAEGLSVAKGTAVGLVVSTGKVDLPNLTGLTTDQARRTLLELNLVLNLTYEESTQPKDTVIRQEPAAGVVDQRSAVSVVAAKEPAPSPTTATTSPTSTGTATSPSGSPTTSP